MKPFECALVAALVLAGAAGPASAQSPEPGRAIAERWCAGCHLVDASQLQGNDGVPTFHAIGSKAWTAASFATALANPHPPMPTLDLTRREMSDLLAFVRSQGQEPKQPAGEPPRN